MKSAQPGVGISGEEEKMRKKRQECNQAHQWIPEEPDDGWWSSLLSSEPLVDADVDDIPLLDSEKKNNKKTLLPEKSTMDWDVIHALLDHDEIISLEVVGFNKGGVLVENDSVKGFVPASHLVEFPIDCCDDVREVELASYSGRKLSLKVIECEPEKDRVVFSERAAMAGAGQRKELLENLSEGDFVRGTVTNVTPFGVFVDLGGVEGLIHISELSWGRVQHPSEILKVGDQVESIVIDIAESLGRIALSLKRLAKNPWICLPSNLNQGEVVDAEITCIEKYGAFARLDIGIEGLIHVSSITFPEGTQLIDDILFIGQSVKVRILNIEPKKRRLGLQLES